MGRARTAFKYLLIAAVAAFVCYVGYAQLKPANDLEVYFLDVGQGDSAFVKTPAGSYILIDGGNEGRGKGAVEPFLKRRFISKVDDMVLSHYHDDHGKGLLEVMDSVGAEKLSMPDIPAELRPRLHDSLRDKAVQKNVFVRYLQRGDEFDTGDAEVTADVLFPSAELLNANDEQNNNSIVLKFTYYDVSFLFTGDIEAKAEKALLQDGRLKSTVIKAPHHGSKTSSSQVFLDNVRPEYATFSAGYNNSYKHPHTEVLDRYAKMGVKTYRTDLDGVIKFIAGKYGIKKVEVTR